MYCESISWSWAPPLLSEITNQSQPGCASGCYSFASPFAQMYHRKTTQSWILCRILLNYGNLPKSTGRFLWITIPFRVKANFCGRCWVQCVVINDTLFFHGATGQLRNRSEWLTETRSGGHRKGISALPSGCMECPGKFHSMEVFVCLACI